MERTFNMTFTLKRWGQRCLTGRWGQTCTLHRFPIHSYARQERSLREPSKSFYPSDLERESSVWRSPMQAAKKLEREMPGSIPFGNFFKHQPISNMKQLGGRGPWKALVKKLKKKKKWERERNRISRLSWVCLYERPINLQQNKYIKVEPESLND